MRSAPLGTNCPDAGPVELLPLRLLGESAGERFEVCGVGDRAPLHVANLVASESNVDLDLPWGELPSITQSSMLSLYAS